MKRSLICFCALVVLLAAVMPLLPLQGEEQIYDNAIRLHVIANSDSEEDQELKLLVRDRILAVIDCELDDCTSRYEAEEKIREIEDILLAEAIEEVNRNGYGYPVRVILENEYYPTREYEGVNMPAGTYLSLRVMLGDATGQNWWCVLYPPLCLDAAAPKKTLSEAGFTPSQIRILTEGENPKYKLKFKFLELIEGLFG